MSLRTGLVAAFLVLSAAALVRADSQVVRGVEVRGQGGRAQIAVRGEFDVPTYAVRARDGGRVIVVDVADARLPDDGVAVEGDSKLIDRTVASSTARGVRIEVHLAQPATYRAHASSGRIGVDFEAVGADAKSPTATLARAADGAATARSTHGAAVVQKVHLEKRDGRERVVVEVEGSPAFRIARERGSARLEIAGATLGPGVGGIAATGEGSLARRIRVRSASGSAIVEVEREGLGTGTAIREGHRIVWLLASAQERSERPKSRAIARAPGLAELTAQDAIDTETETPEVAGFLSDIPLQVEGARGDRRYAGRRIDLDFKDADIHNVLRLISEVGGVNIVTSDEVSGTVTIRMRGVPWDQALEVILQAKGLGMVRRGNLIRVAPQTVLQKEQEAALALMQQQAILAPTETRLIPVSYATAGTLAPRVRELLTGRGSVSTDERTNVLIVRDVVGTLDDIEELVRALDTQTPQVLIEARIVEATSQYSRDVGIQWGGDVTMSSATGNPTGLTFPSNMSVVGGNYDRFSQTQGLSPFEASVQPPNYAVNLPAITGTGQGGAIGLSLGSVSGNVNLAVRLSAAEANGIVRIISSPRILTLDNSEAHIAQGTLIPYSQVSAQGVNTAFQEAKLELRVRPHVTADGSIAMHVKITRDEPDFTRTSNRGDPTILKREAETDLLISDGNTAVIGGIYTRNTGRNIDQIPFFGDIPILGVLFQRRRVRDDRNELLIFLTPRIVNRAEALPE